MAKAISEKKPWKSRSLGVHPNDAQAYQEELRKAGVPAEVGRDGHPIVFSDSARNKLLEYESRIRGENIIDRDGGYGQFTGR